MKRNLLWLIGIVALVAAAALLRPQPTAPPRPTPTPLRAPTPNPNPELLSYFEETLKKERFLFRVLGRPGSLSFYCLMTVEWKNIEDSGSLSEIEFRKIQTAIQKASEAGKTTGPFDLFPPIPVTEKLGKVVDFSLSEQNQTLVGHPAPDSLTRQVLDRELQPTLVFQERDQLRKEMHARFNL